MSKAIKPTKKIIVEGFDYHECTKYIEEKYNINTRDYAGKFSVEKQLPLEKIEEIPYQDFWHWIVSNNEIHNGCVFKLYAEDAEDMEDWQQEILKLYLDEFADNGEDIIFWVDW